MRVLRTYHPLLPILHVEWKIITKIVEDLHFDGGINTSIR
jgi:hypothetical protein